MYTINVSKDVAAYSWRWSQCKGERHSLGGKNKARILVNIWNRDFSQEGFIYAQFLSLKT